MITDALLALVTGIMVIIQYAFSAINFVIPNAIPQAFNTFFSYVRIGDGLFPFLGDALLAMLTIITVWALLYVIKIILFAFSAIPFIGKTLNLPVHKTISQTTASTTFDDNGNPHTVVNKFTGTRTTTKKRRWER